MQFPPTGATRHHFSNGFCAILEEDHSAPVVSARLWVETGSAHEGDWAGSGISHLLEHMVFKGTRSYDVTELARAVNAAGGQWNAYTSFDQTVYQIDGPAHEVSLFLKILCEMVFHPRLPQPDFETERDVIRREIAMGNDDPDSVHSKVLFSTVYQFDTRKHPVIGHRALFDLIGHDTMVNYHRDHYLPANSFLVLSGAIDTSAVLADLEGHAGEMPNQPFTSPSLRVEPEQVGARLSREEFAIPHSHLSLAWPVPALDHPDAPALELLSGVLGGGRASRLHLKLHEEEELAYHISAWSWSPPRGPGIWCVSAESDRADRDPLEERIQEEINDAFDHLATEDLARCKRQLFAHQFKTLTTASGRAGDLGSNWHEARNLNYTGHFLAQLDEVTMDDLRRVRDRWLTPSRLSTVSLDPETTGVTSAPAVRRRAPGPISRHTLSNGLTVLLRPDPRVPTVFLQAPFRAGLPSERPETSGLNALHTAVLSQGPKALTTAAFAREIESLGASLRASSGNNTSILSSFCLKPDLPRVLRLARDVVLTPGLREDDFERLREVQTADLLEALEDPVKTAFREMRRAIFGNQHYGLARLGTRESLASLTPERIRVHHGETFRAANGVLALFGDVDPDEVLPLLENSFGDLPEGAPAASKVLTPTGKGEVTATLDRQQAVLAIGYPGAGVDSEDAPALELIHEYCSNMAGPLFTRIREELGLAYFVNATQFHGIGTGLFAFYLGTAPEQLDLARAELLTAIARIAEDGIPAADLAATKNSVAAADALQNQSNRSMAQTCAINTLFGLGEHHHEENLARIQALDGPQIQAVAAKYFGAQEPVIATVLPTA